MHMRVGGDPCQQCGSSYKTELDTEACVHVPGLENVDFPGVLVFSKLSVCLECGSVSRFHISDDQVAVCVLLREVSLLSDVFSKLSY